MNKRSLVASLDRGVCAALRGNIPWRDRSLPKLQRYVPGFELPERRLAGNPTIGRYPGIPPMPAWQSAWRTALWKHSAIQILWR